MGLFFILQEMGGLTAHSLTSSWLRSIGLPPSGAHLVRCHPRQGTPVPRPLSGSTPKAYPPMAEIPSFVFHTQIKTRP